MHIVASNRISHAVAGSLTQSKTAFLRFVVKRTSLMSMACALAIPFADADMRMIEI